MTTTVEAAIWVSLGLNAAVFMMILLLVDILKNTKYNTEDLLQNLYEYHRDLEWQQFKYEYDKNGRSKE